MHEYKKRVRLLAERYGANLGYAHDGGLTVTSVNGRIDFTSTSKRDMKCTVTTSTYGVTFTVPKLFVFDIIRRFTTGRPIDEYKPNGLPLTLQEYINEEHAESCIAELKKCVVAGTAVNRELGGNHYNAEYFDGILVLFDIFTGAPANVIEFAKNTFAG